MMGAGSSAGEAVCEGEVAHDASGCCGVDGAGSFQPGLTTGFGWGSWGSVVTGAADWGMSSGGSSSDSAGAFASGGSGAPH